MPIYAANIGKDTQFLLDGYKRQMSSDSEANEEAKQYTACVSDAFVKEELSEAELTYDVYFLSLIHICHSLESR